MTPQRQKLFTWIGIAVAITALLPLVLTVLR